jgi:hypothetical protein
MSLPHLLHMVIRTLNHTLDPFAFWEGFLVPVLDGGIRCRVEFNHGKQMEKEKAARESGDEGRMDRSQSINLNRVPSVAVEAGTTQKIGETQSAVVSETKYFSAVKAKESSGADQKLQGTDKMMLL